MKNRKLYYIALLPCAIGIIIGSFFDYKINDAVFLRNNGFGIFFSAFAPIIGYGVLVVLCGFVHRAAIKEKIIWVKICYFLASMAGFISMLIISAGHVTSVNAYDCPEWKWLWIIIEALIYGGIFVIGDYYGKQNSDQKLVFASLVLAAFIIIDLVPVGQILKAVVSRPRFRIVVDNPYGFKASYTDWWQHYDGYDALKEQFGATTRSFSEHFKSFPSGHTGVAAILIFGLPFLCNIIPQLKGKETLTFIIGMVFTVLMAFSRMSVGAHYLTDVSFGALFMIVLCIVANEINLKFFLVEEDNVK